MSSTRPIRFGTVFHGFRRELRLEEGQSPVDGMFEIARAAERIGYSTFAFNDHVPSRYAPLIALQAIADRTTTLRLSQLVLNQDFRHPVFLAKEAATLDVLSGGRVEIGIGAGWMRSEYEQAGIEYRSNAQRIERLEEVLVILKGLFRQGPFSFSGDHFTIDQLEGQPKPQQPAGPPIMVGGGGRKLLAVAARHADIIQVGSGPVSQDGTMRVTVGEPVIDGFAERISWIRDEAGERFDDIELCTLLRGFAITDDPEQAAQAYLDRMKAWVGGVGGELDASAQAIDHLLADPGMVIGTLDEVCEKVLALRSTYGFSYFFTPFGVPMEAMAPVVERLSGT